jgi:hypothetical protein
MKIEFIKFSALGLTFDADITYTPGTQETDPEISFITLSCNGADARFLLDAYTQIVDAIYMAALNAVEG